MHWTQRLDEILHYRLFDLGRQGITLSHILLAGVILVATVLCARMVRRVCNRRIPSQVGLSARYTITRLSQNAVWAAGIFLSLKALNIDVSEIALMAGALGVGIGLGLQSMVENFVAGIVILFAQPIKVKDRVTIQNIEGDVMEINFRCTTILTNDNIAMIVPNSSFINSTVINWTLGDPRVRLHVPVGVAYGSDVALVTRTMLEAAGRIDQVLREPVPEVRYTGFGDSTLNFDLLVWTDDPHDHYVIQSRVRYELDAAFRQKGIEMPFPSAIFTFVPQPVWLKYFPGHRAPRSLGQEATPEKKAALEKLTKQAIRCRMVFEPMSEQSHPIRSRRKVPNWSWWLPVCSLLFSLSSLACGKPGIPSAKPQIRVANKSDHVMEDVLIKFLAQAEEYGTIPAHGVTEYRTIQKAYSYAYIEATVKGEQAVLQPIDFVGEKLLGGGKYTYELSVNEKSTSKYDRLQLRFSRD